MEVIDILRKLISFNTIEDKENKEIIEWIEKYLQEIGFTCTKIIDETTQKGCLIAEIGENPQLAFCGHLDTVNATEKWKRNPLELTIEDDKIYGLGVCDMKGGISAFLKACSNINKEKLKNGVKLFFTYDEEINFEGINLLLKNKVKFPKLLILAEPTDLKPVTATKGCIEMKVTFYGKSSHSSMPDQGKSAIIEAHKFIGELLEFYEELKKETNEIFSIPYTTMNIGKINGGDAINKVPDECCIEFDARTIAKEHNKIIVEKVKSILEKYEAKLEIGIDIKSNINTNEKMIKEIEKMTQCKAQSENYVTEASFIPESESIILGVGPVTAHQCDEHIEIEKLEKLVKIYDNILQNYEMFL